MSEHSPYLLDQLESADLLEIDGLHAFDFSLDDDLLDQADAAAEADESFASDAIALRIDVRDGRDLKHWAFSYNSLMEASHDAASDSWLIDGKHRLSCLQGVGVETDIE
ncbi:DUF5629 family protein [Pseudomonas sp. LRF_L74]|uniref:DUF5629 family protein n=1 Tax=Pseudomonas sp. LRF_L74 TaxID=3369422 RepID=UPI003F5EE9BC